ncbi:MAG: hypothetical protein AAGC95_06145 [Pseudomonadota bacterium]
MMAAVSLLSCQQGDEDILAQVFPGAMRMSSADVDEMRRQNSAKLPKYESAYASLSEIGYRLNDGFSLDEVIGAEADNLNSMLEVGVTVLLLDAEQIGPEEDTAPELSEEQEILVDLLWAMGGARSTETDLGYNIELYSNDVSFIDFEMIEDNESYVLLMRDMAALVKNDFSIKPLRSFVSFADVEGKDEAWLEFSVNDQTRRWDFKVDYDWVDPTFFTRFDEIVETYSPNKRLWSFNDGQADLFFIRNEADARKLADLIGMELRDWRAYRQN